MDLFGGPRFWPLYILPWLMGTIVLGINAQLSRQTQFTGSYKFEGYAIEFVERNSSWFLIGSSALFAWASLVNGSLGLGISLVPFVIYESLCISLLTPSILLYWIPYTTDPETAHGVGRLRHYKTIPFTYAVSFFVAAVLTILVGSLRG
jgi:ABC-type uncharacterized transport system permease subunit